MFRRLFPQRDSRPLPQASRVDADHPDPAVRATATQQLSDPERLMRLAGEDGDVRVRQTAAARLRRLLVGGDGSLDLDQRLAGVRATPDVTLLAHVARRAREPELRLAAVRRVSGQRLLSEVVAEDEDIRVRLTALERLDSIDAVTDLLGRLRHDDDPRIVSLVAFRRDSLERARQRGRVSRSGTGG